MYYDITENIKQQGKQPTQTKENTSSIESVKSEIVGEVQNTLTSEDVQRSEERRVGKEC